MVLLDEDLIEIAGIGKATAEKLVGAGIPSSVVLASTSVAKLVTIGFTKTNSHKMLREARAHCEGVFGFLTREKYEQEYNDRQFLTTGVEIFDKLLGGGFETQKIYEVYGPHSTAKTILLHQLICTASLPENKGGLNSNSIYIDTHFDFSPKRLRRIAPRFDIDPEKVGDYVIKSTPSSSDMLMFLCEVMLCKAAIKYNTRLICLDTLSTPFRSEYGADRRSFKARNQRVTKIIQSLKQVARYMNGVVVIANQTEPNLTGMGRDWRRWGYHWQQDTNVCLSIRIINRHQEIVRIDLERAIDLPRDDIDLKITPKGFINPLAKKSDES